MGWLFAVALGLHRGSRTVVLVSLLPIALGHALAVAAALAGVLALGLATDITILHRVAGGALLGWAVWHAVRGHRQRVRVGMQTGLAGLAVWSFMVSAAHGAGLMLVPAVMPLCLSASSTVELPRNSLMLLAAVAAHTSAMLAVSAAVAITVYEWVGLAFLRRGWINLDLIWIAALGICGLVLLV